MVWHSVSDGARVRRGPSGCGGLVAFVTVRLTAPNGSRYRVEIDPELRVETVKSQLVQKLDLPPDRKYTLQLIDSFSLTAGDELKLVVTEVQGVGLLEPDNG